MHITGEKPRPVVAAPNDPAKLTDGEMIALYREAQALVANSGTFEIKESALHMRPIIAKSTAFMAS
jgi:hypothetical protein